MAQMFPKVAPKVDDKFFLKEMFFETPPKITKYLGHFYKKIFDNEH